MVNIKVLNRKGELPLVLSLEETKKEAKVAREKGYLISREVYDEKEQKTLFQAVNDLDTIKESDDLVFAPMVTGG